MNSHTASRSLTNVPLLLRSTPTTMGMSKSSPQSPAPGPTHPAIICLFLLIYLSGYYYSVCFTFLCFRSVQFSRLVVSDLLWPHESQHARPPCPSPTPGVYQTHVHWVSDAIQPSHALSSPSPPAPNPSQDQGLFQWVNSSHDVTKVLEFQLQHQSFQWTPRTALLSDELVGSSCSSFV